MVASSPASTLLSRQQSPAAAERPAALDDRQGTLSNLAELATQPGGAGHISSAAVHELGQSAASASPLAAANKLFENGQDLLDSLTAFYKHRGEHAPHINKYAAMWLRASSDKTSSYMGRCNGGPCHATD
jgi:hypothetical protein